MFAVFESGGKQHRVSEGDVVRLETLGGAPGDDIVFDRVMVVADGDDVEVGAPFVKDGKVKGEVLSQGRGRKIRVVKFKRRKNYLRRAGHRQGYTEVRITAISH